MKRRPRRLLEQGARLVQLDRSTAPGGAGEKMEMRGAVSRRHHGALESRDRRHARTRSEVASETPSGTRTTGRASALVETRVCSSAPCRSCASPAAVRLINPLLQLQPERAGNRSAPCREAARGPDRRVRQSTRGTGRGWTPPWKAASPWSRFGPWDRHDDSCRLQRSESGGARHGRAARCVWPSAVDLGVRSRSLEPMSRKGSIPRARVDEDI